MTSLSRLPGLSCLLVRNPDRMDLVDAPELFSGSSQTLVEMREETLAELREKNRTLREENLALKERIKALEIEVIAERLRHQGDGDDFQLGDV